MKMYLSSYELGNETEKLREMIPKNNKLAYVFNALDFTGSDPERKAKRCERNMHEMEELGFNVFDLDLRKYFNKKDELEELVDSLGSIWISGGNVFVLRQAMLLSGLDDIMLELNHKENFLYGGYSAAGCVLSPTLKGYDLVDDATDTPFEGVNEVVWDGLGIIDYTFIPHFQSVHPESDKVNDVVTYCKENELPYKTLRDGEVILTE